MTNPEALATEIRKALAEVTSFICSPAMQDSLRELYALPEEDRAEYVLDVLLSPDAQERRGITIPPGLVIQRSAFRDNRPTLFCVTKHLPPDLGWQKVTVTFDNATGAPAIPYSQFEDAAAM